MLKTPVRCYQHLCCTWALISRHHILLSSRTNARWIQISYWSLLNSWAHHQSLFYCVSVICGRDSYILWCNIWNQWAKRLFWFSRGQTFTDLIRAIIMTQQARIMSGLFPVYSEHSDVCVYCMYRFISRWWYRNLLILQGIDEVTVWLEECLLHHRVWRWKTMTSLMRQTECCVACCMSATCWERKRSLCLKYRKEDHKDLLSLKVIWGQPTKTLDGRDYWSGFMLRSCDSSGPPDWEKMVTRWFFLQIFTLLGYWLWCCSIGINLRLNVEWRSVYCATAYDCVSVEGDVCMDWLIHSCSQSFSMGGVSKLWHWAEISFIHYVFMSQSKTSS